MGDMLVTRLKILVYLLVLGALTSCVSAPETITCPHRDWFEIGRQDGTLGRDFKHFFAYQRQCSDSKNKPDPILYTNGRNAGLIEYCSPQNALEAGRTGETYYDVCPEYLESEFLEFFNKGQKIFALQKDNATIDTRVQGLFSKLTKQLLDSENRLVLEKQIKSLRAQRAQNITEIQKLEKEAATF